MKVEIITTGSELLLGSILNTHQQWLSSRLTGLGFVVIRQTTVSDRAEEIKSAVSEALQRADIVITTGGLGPTSDDRTRDAIAELVGKRLIFNEQVAENIRNYFVSRKREQPESTKIQALVPEGAIVLFNQFGTAPGLLMEVEKLNRLEKGRTLLIMLPGPPRELHPMFENQVVSELKKRFKNENYACKILRSTGIGESKVEETIAEQLKPFEDRGLTIGYCARPGEVDIRLEARGDNSAELVSQAEIIIRRNLGSYIFGEGDETLEQVIVRILTEKRQTLAVAESCTGGLVANRITNVSGASVVFWGGVVSYANEAKMKILGVSENSLRGFGAVSEQVAREMAEGLKRFSGVDYSIAITGIAGPTGGTTEKPVGTVFIAVSTPEKTIVSKNFNPYDRETFKQVTSQQALEMARRNMLNI
ncbi:MAG: competence/damage-inducible protein A [Verrucomicrobiae bacterium]|nr:competence/damage-inducible protein A [Verrucomicrobiae bacterium]